MVLIGILIGIIALFIWLMFTGKASIPFAGLMGVLEQDCPHTGKTIDEYVLSMRTHLRTDNRSQIRSTYFEMAECFPGIKNRLDNHFTATETQKIKGALLLERA